MIQKLFMKMRGFAIWNQKGHKLDGHKQVMNTGVDTRLYVKKNSYRPAAVCLGFLCLLLVAGLITRTYLCDKEIDQLQTSNTDLIREKNQLETRCNKLTRERDQLQTSYSNLVEEKDQLQTSYRPKDQLQTKKDQLQTSFNNLTSYNNLEEEKDQLQTSYNNLVEEKDQQQTRYNNLTSYNNLVEEKDQLQTSYNNLKDQLQTSYNNLVEEKDQLQTSYNNLVEDYNNLVEEKDQLQSRHNILLNLSIATLKCLGLSKHFFYYISSVKKNWNESRNDCLQRGADLVIIDSEEKQSFTERLPDRIWIGLKYNESTEWKWVDETLLTQRFTHYSFILCVCECHKATHNCTWYQSTLDQRSMINFIVVLSDLRWYVLDTQVKRGEELSTDHHLVMSWI
uniref:C-type lectin domain-containing protein n=1 Tax=Amphiprion ocellaris TaxID=80972 RepID=A0A3Q1C6X7_AMPOC